MGNYRGPISGELPWPRYWGIHLGPHGPYRGYTMALDKDSVALWRFKNQVRILNKAKACCERNNISPKAISLKLLCPLLEGAALEEDETLQDKWAILLSNMVDSEQNIQNHVFPYILSQMSSNEFLFVERVFRDKKGKSTFTAGGVRQIPN